jgi:hypothetical protein
MQAQETLFGLTYNLRKEKKKGGFNTLAWEVVFLMFYGPKWDAPPFSGENLQKINKQKLVENATKPPNNFKNISVSENQKFLTIKTTYNVLNESYSMT